MKKELIQAMWMSYTNNFSRTFVFIPSSVTASLLFLFHAVSWSRTKQRINIREFLKLLEALAHTSKQQGVTVEVLMAKLEQSGSPTISEIPHTKASASATSSKKHI